MKLRNLNISTKMILNFIVLILFVLLLGLTSFYQTNELFKQAETLYNHPLKVRSAIKNINSDILNLRIGLRDLMLAETEKEQRDALELMELSHADATKQFHILEESYLGPTKDVENLYKAYYRWYATSEESEKLIYLGEIEKVEDFISKDGLVGSYRQEMINYVNVIDEFARNKENELYNKFIDLDKALKVQLTIILCALLLGSIAISYVLLHSIRTPLHELRNVANKISDGDMGARSKYINTDEFGQVSSSFNLMASRIQHNMELNTKTTKLARVMLRKEDTEEFFKLTLTTLAKSIDAQLAAVYLTNKNKGILEHFVSIGLDDGAKKSFDINDYEGEFGQSILTRKYSIIRDIPDDIAFVFNSINGSFRPKEIITIPVLTKNEIIAMISLGCLHKFKEVDIELIGNITDILNARVEGILANQTIKEFKDALEQQNRELDTQKTELSAQTAELIQQNTELEMQKKQLTEVSRLKTNFLSNMSHELRTPLNSVIALSGVLFRKLAGKISEEEHSYLEVIERNGKNLLNLINDILDISRIEAGREEVNVSKFNAKTTTLDVIEMLNPQAKQKQIELLYDLDSDIYITSDDDKYRHILQNIIGNAIKFTDKGKVEVSTEVEDNMLQVTISDTGIGISEDHLPHIFDEFRQADGSTSRRFGGAGLGLAIAKNFTLLLGGKINVTSKINYGTTFTISLPLIYDKSIAMIDEDEIEETIVTDTPSPTYRDTNKTILLIEDSEPAIIQIKDLMVESGYNLLIAHNGKEAFDVLDQFIPDAIILDLMMPEIDGFEVLRVLREKDSTAYIPVLILTAKHITKAEFSYLKRNHIHQLIQKGAINRHNLLKSVEVMLYPPVKATSNVTSSNVINIESKHKPLVLVAEDNVDNMITIKALLSENYKVIEATDGQEAINMAKKHNPDLILMDISLPGVDGIDAFKAIRSIGSLHKVPIIAVTASAMIHDRERILSHGFDAFISKPIIENEFFRIVRNMINDK